MRTVDVPMYLPETLYVCILKLKSVIKDNEIPFLSGMENAFSPLQSLY